MAGVPCFNDTCSNIITVDGNGRLSVNSRLDPTGGISCGTDADPNSGLRLNILGDPAPVAAGSVLDCENLLNTTTDGLIFARRPGYERASFGGTKQDIPSGGANSANSVNATITNPSDCSKLAIITAIFGVQYTASAGEYSSQITAELEVNGSVLISSNMDIAGDNNLGGTDQRAVQQAQTVFTVIGAGDPLAMQVYARRGSGAGEYGVSATGGSWNGLTGRVNVVVLDLASRDEFTI